MCSIADEVAPEILRSESGLRNTSPFHVEHHSDNTFLDHVWPRIEQSIPIERIGKLFPLLHEDNLKHLCECLYAKLQQANFNPDVIKDLRSRAREHFTLCDLFAYVHIDYVAVKNHFRSNPQDREDVAAYILTAGIVIVRIMCPNTWMDIYPDTSAMQAHYTEFANESLSSLNDLLKFSNVMYNALRFVSAIGNQQRLLTICACLAEGPRHARYVTGSAQSQRTSNRVLIYRTLSNTAKVTRPNRKEKSLPKQTEPGVKKRNCVGSLLVPSSLHPTAIPLPTPAPTSQPIYRPLPQLLSAFRSHIHTDLPVLMLQQGFTPVSIGQYRNRYMQRCDTPDADIVYYDTAPPSQTCTTSAQSPTLEAINSLQYIEDDIVSPRACYNGVSSFRSIVSHDSVTRPVTAPAIHPSSITPSSHVTHCQSPLADEFMSLKRRRLIPPTAITGDTYIDMDAVTDDECSKSSRSNSSVDNVTDYFVLTSLAIVREKKFCTMSDVDIRVNWNHATIPGNMVSYTATEFELPISKSLLWEDLMLMLAVEHKGYSGTVLLNGDDVKSMIVSQNPTFWLNLSDCKADEEVSMQVSLKVLHK